MTRVKRIPLLPLFFLSAVELALEEAHIDLVLMSAAALAILLWGGGCGSRDTLIRLPEKAPRLPRTARSC